MRVSQEEKERTHQKIILSAARMIRERGVEGASVADVMTDAGLTHGGFYRHFENKDAMVAAALDSAFSEILTRLIEPGDDGADDAAFEAFVDRYLSDGHVAHPGVGCPIASVSPDMARAPVSVRERFSDGVRRMAAALTRVTKGDEARRRARAYRQLAMMAGAVMIARASDPDVARDVLEACRDGGDA